MLELMSDRAGKVIRAGVITSALMFSSACAGVSSTIDGAELEAKVDAIVEKQMKTSGYPGMAVLISRGGNVVLEKGYGLADVENNIAVSPDTPFPIGSITKSFTGLAIAQLVADGKLSLDDTVRDHIPEFPAHGDKIKVRNLLNHTSGLLNYTDIGKVQSNQGKTHTHDEMMGYFKDLPVAFEPGEKMSYSNSGFYLLGMIIERVSGMPYGEYVTKNIFVPFGMNDSRYPSETFDNVQNMAFGYKPGKGGVKRTASYSPTLPYSAGAIVSTVGDLFKYAEAVHHSNKVSKKVRKNIYTKDSLNDGTIVDYSLGALVTTDLEGVKRVSHMGDVWGYGAHFAHFPKQDVTVTILTNNSRAVQVPSSVTQKLSRAALGLEQPVIVDSPLSEAEAPSLFEGDFKLTTASFGPLWQFGFHIENDRLHVKMGGLAAPGSGIPLLYQGDNKFVASYDDEFTFAFSRDSSGDHVNFKLFDGTFVGKKVQ